MGAPSRPARHPGASRPPPPPGGAAPPPPPQAAAAPSVDDLFFGMVGNAPNPAETGGGGDLLGGLGESGPTCVAVQGLGAVGGGDGGGVAREPGGWITFDSTADNPFGDADPFAIDGPSDANNGIISFGAGAGVAGLGGGSLGDTGRSKV